MPNHPGVGFERIDVLGERALRRGVEAFSDRPAVPQHYVKGEFIGGADIVRETFETGELARLPARRGAKIAASA